MTIPRKERLVSVGKSSAFLLIETQTAQRAIRLAQSPTEETHCGDLCQDHHSGIRGLNHEKSRPKHSWCTSDVSLTLIKSHPMLFWPNSRRGRKEVLPNGISHQAP
ncbi:hypothetical protein PoB_004431800 [Plakobranchus ocellatus]|uniref:Uncharacterized protein n=1 Tax=Plakobranchus ocellatus TaxID=259542 RepID=A0AAV4BE14_9GAST|nr:hypothetical protein PoB_004431800 [Plakobranchus ocellatus]